MSGNCRAISSVLLDERSIMKKLIVLVALPAAALAVLRKRRAKQADADLWREATAPE
jgi:hypothetical protein